MSLSAWTVHNAAIDGATLDGVDGHMVTEEQDVRGLASAGARFVGQQALVGRSVGAELTVGGIGSLLAQLDDSTALPMLDIVSGLVLYLGKDGVGADYAAGLVHRTATIAKGLVFMTGLSVDGDGMASASAGVVGVSADGSTPAVAYGTAALPSLADPEKWRLTALTLGGVAYDQVMSLSLSIDVPVFASKSTGDIDVAHAAIAAAAGQIGVSLSAELGDVDLAVALSGNGSAGSVSFVLEKLSGAGYSGDSITFTINGPLTLRQGAGGSAGQSASASIQVTGSGDDSTPPLAWAVA